MRPEAMRVNRMGSAVGSTMSDITIGPLRPEQEDEAARLLARAFVTKTTVE